MLTAQCNTSNKLVSDTFNITLDRRLVWYSGSGWGFRSRVTGRLLWCPSPKELSSPPGGHHHSIDPILLSRPFSVIWKTQEGHSGRVRLGGNVQRRSPDRRPHASAGEVQTEVDQEPEPQAAAEEPR